MKISGSQPQDAEDFWSGEMVSVTFSFHIIGRCRDGESVLPGEGLVCVCVCACVSVCLSLRSPSMEKVENCGVKLPLLLWVPDYCAPIQRIHPYKVTMRPAQDKSGAFPSRGKQTLVILTQSKSSLDSGKHLSMSFGSTPFQDSP